MLIFKNTTKSYHKDNQTIHALDDFSLSVSRGDFIAIKGPSGCGKTTLLLAAGGLLHPNSGKVIIDGTNIYDLTTEQRASFRAQNIGFVFQQYHLIPYLTVLENIQAPSLAQKRDVPESRLKELVGILGLTNRLKHTPAELSAGEKQRTALARALLFNPCILLADEITGNLDEANIDIVMNCLATYNRSGGTILLVTHDNEVSKKAKRMVSL
ncbi:MAG: ABC transporter ATP-binding protein [Marinilabiliaceae bacterium]|nr:ABC transporter ATP-binding protein [Marinilabiliaceae bacterium]